MDRSCAGLFFCISDTSRLQHSHFGMTQTRRHNYRAAAPPRPRVHHSHQPRPRVSDNGGMDQYRLTHRIKMRDAAAENPLALVQKALSQTKQDASQYDLSRVRQGMSPALLEGLLIEILGARPEVDPPFPPSPSSLPLSLDFEPGDDGSMRAIYSEKFDYRLRRMVRDRAGNRCEHCGRGDGDLYLNQTWDHGKQEKGPLTVNVQGALQVAHIGSDPSLIDPAELMALCYRCHNRLDFAHQRGSKLLTFAMRGTLGHEELQIYLNRLRDITSAAARPLGALQPGGADVMTAVLARGQSVGGIKIERAKQLIPALATEPDADIRRVLHASVKRLRIRGLMTQDGYELTRHLSLTTPAQKAPRAQKYGKRTATGAYAGYTSVKPKTN